MKSAGVAIIGILLGAITCVGALGIGGAGHGWVTPIWFAPVTLILYPLALLRRDRKSGAIIVGLALLLNITLVVQTWREGFEYVERVGWIAPAWLVLWLGWQVVAAANLTRGRAI